MKKLSISELKVQSFITQTSSKSLQTIRGGDPNPVIVVDGITDGFGGCIESVNVCTNDCGSLDACTDTIQITD